jgi:hypothetical protein
MRCPVTVQTGYDDNFIDDLVEKRIWEPFEVKSPVVA